jgi:PKD repeat protein
VIVANTPPTASALAITPISPKKSDNLTGSYTYNDVDNDPQGASKIKWYKNSVLQTTYTTLTVSSSALTKGDKWYFTVEPYDGTSYGALQTSPTVTVINTPPVASALAISPTSPKKSDSLTGSYTYSDIDGDPESTSEIRWYRNSSIETAYNNKLIIPSIILSSGDKWYFTVQPYDGVIYSTLQTSPTVTVDNTPPIASNPSINPPSPTRNYSLTGSYTYSDLDNNPETNSEIRWYKNNVLQTLYNNKLIILSSDLSVGDSWYFTVKPYDGISYGTLQTSPTVTVVNLIPVASALAITPSSPKKSDTLTGSYTYSDVDNDPQGASKIKWYKNSVLQTAYTTLTVASSALVKGDKWYFTVEPYDGISYGALQTSPTVTVINTPPVASALAISPTSPKKSDSLIGSYTYSDADNDPQGISKVKWYKNSVLQTAYTTLTVPSTTLVVGDSWYFTVEPYDGTNYGTLQTSPVVKVKNQSPVAKAGGSYSGAIGVPVSFTSSGSTDPDGNSLTYAWDFDHRNGTGNVDSTEANPTHTYTEVGVYTVTLTVNDGIENSIPVTATVDIKVGVNGSVKLQGYTKNSANVTIEFRPVGKTTVLKGVDTLLSNGNFNILTDITPGVYDLIAKAKHYLKGRARSVNISSGLGNVVFSSEISGISAGELRGGDCNDDNAVTLTDFSMIAQSFGKTNVDIDINGDGFINILDFAILSTNFGCIGVDGRIMKAPSENSAPGDGSNRQLKLYVYADKDPNMMLPGDEFNVLVKFDNADNLEGYFLKLHYDPHAIQIVSSSDGSFLKSNSTGNPALFISKTQRDGIPEGNVILSSCITNDNYGVSGSGVVATLRFRLLQNSPSVISVQELNVIDNRGKFNNLSNREFNIRSIPNRTLLMPNYPNPFNPETWVPFELSEASDVKISIYNSVGQLVRTLNLGYKQSGFYTGKNNAAYWDGKNEAGEQVSSGIYFYNMKCGDFMATRKMIVLR